MDQVKEVMRYFHPEEGYCRRIRAYVYFRDENPGPIIGIVASTVTDAQKTGQGNDNVIVLSDHNRDCSARNGSGVVFLNVNSRVL